MTTFTAGEWSPKSLGRRELPKYARAMKKLRNFIPHKVGGVQNRSGTRFVASAKSASTACRLATFAPATDQTYILEFSNLAIRFFKNKAQMLDGVTPTEIAAPWATADLPDLHFAQSGDRLYIAHPSYNPYELRRGAGADTTPSTWTLARHDFRLGPFQDVNQTAVTLTPSAVTGSVTITASSATFADTDAPDGSNVNYGRWVRIRHGAQWGVARITAFGSTTSVTALVFRDFASATASTEWRLGSWSRTTGYPALVTFHDNRLFWARTTTEWQTLWGSVIGDYPAHYPSRHNDGVILADYAINYTINDDQIDAIRAMKSLEDNLILFTDGGPFLGKGRSAIVTDATAPFEIKREGDISCHARANIQLIGRTILLVNAPGTVVHEFVFSFEADGYVNADMTLLADHVAFADEPTDDSGFVETAMARQPDSILWCLRADGAILAMTYERDIDTVAWHRHGIGGGVGEADAIVESIAVIRDGFDDLLWMAIKRRVGGADVRYIEFMEPLYDARRVEDGLACFLDSALTYDGAAATVISGLDHLIGKSVMARADGATVGPFTVDPSGRIVLENAAEQVVVGFPYTSIATTVRLTPAGNRDTWGENKRATRYVIDLLDARGGMVGFGEDEDQCEEIPTRMQEDDPNAPPPLFTGLKPIEGRGSSDLEVAVTFVQDEPQPFSVRGILAEFQSA